MTDYRIIYVDFNENKCGVCARRSMDINDKLNHVFTYHEKVKLKIMNENWAMYVESIVVPVRNLNGTSYTRGECIYYIPLYLDGKPTCMLDKDFFKAEKKKFEEYNNTLEELKKLKEEKIVSELKKEKEETKEEEKKETKEKKKTIPKKVKLLVWNLYIGEDNVKGACFCCGKTEIKITDFHCGHFVSVKNNGETTIDNLRPICSGCNLSMGSQNMDEFMKYITTESPKDLPKQPRKKTQRKEIK